MENSKRLVKERLSSPTYNEMMSMGKEELGKLRKEEQQRLVEKTAYQIEKDKSGNLLVPKTAQQMELKPKKQNILQKQRDRDYVDDGTTNEALDNFYAIGGMATMAGMVMWRGDGDDESDEIPAKTAPAEGNAAPVLAYANPTGTTAILDQSTATMPSALPDVDLPTVQMAAATSVIDANPNVFEDVPVLSKEEKIEAAEKAMESYLSKDDGGDDWLASMKDIIDEE